MSRLSVVLVCLLGVCAAGCARVPPPPYALNCSIEGAPPRLLVSAEEIAVPLVIANSGSRPWDPARIHASYHWLFLIPRELASRSRWNVPYQNGIRSELGGPVAPGGTVRVEGRLLAPTVPGVYWLQWDMVDEGAVWFAQVAPRQPRTLVLVAPPLMWLFAPLPLIVAVMGAVRATANATRVAAPRSRVSRIDLPYDVLWCGTVLLAKPFVIIHDALLEPTRVAYWLIAALALGISAGLALLPRRLRLWSSLAIGLFASGLILSDVVYYRFFGDVLSAPALLGAHQTGQVWGSIRSLVTPELAWLVIDCPFAVWMVIGGTRAGGRELDWHRRLAVTVATLGAVALAGLAIGAPRALAATPLDQMFRNRAVVEQLGPFGYHAYDAWAYARTVWWKPAVTDAAIAEAVDWFARRAPLRSGPASPAFGAARGQNLIVVQVESLQDFVVDLSVDGQEVMPHLRRWSRDSIRFTNVTDQTSEGRTSDAEFTTQTSLLPLDHGAVAFRYPGNHYVALPRVLHDHGYATLSAVPFEPGFWNRRVMHPSYGFERSLFEPDFQLTEQIGWGLNDRDFLQQMVPRLERLPQPFVAWMITLSLHHPFDGFPAAHKTLKLGAVDDTSFGNYLHTMRFFDDALDLFRQSLERDGLWNRSVVVVFGDHDAGFARSPELASAMQIGSDEVAWALNDRIPWFVKAPAAPGARAVPAGQTDFAPTLLALLGIDAAPLPYIGRNLLGTPDDPPIVRPYLDWIDARHLSLALGSDRACVDLDRRAFARAGDCASSDAAARRTHEISRLVVVDDLQQRIATALRHSP